MDYGESSKIIKDSLSNVMQFAETAKQVATSLAHFRETIDQLRPLFEGLYSIAAIYKTADILADNQFVVVNRLPSEVVENVDSLDIDDLAAKYLMDEGIVNSIKDASDLNHNRLFSQSIVAFNNHQYDLAILGLVAVLDRTLSERSGQIKNIHIKPRCEALKKKIEEKGESILDELEGRDFLLFITYPKAMESFGEYRDFLSPEPFLLNRYWIMHGRSSREYTRLDCVKVLNMIYGTIRMGELGKQDDAMLNEKNKAVVMEKEWFWKIQLTMFS